MRTEWQINDYIPNPDTGNDRWQIHEILKGGIGVVYIVYDTEWREAFAVKTYQDRLQSEYSKEQFKKEAHIWINLDRHENIAWARFSQNIHNRLYLFLEYVPGGDLSRWIGTKRLDLKQVLLFALQFCYGMEHALAKGVKAHRDIKPQNCLITEDGTLKITDFGLAKAFDTAEFLRTLAQPSAESLADITTTHTGQAGGTLPYMAPEQFDDLKHVDVKADIYSFGTMFYEMLSGHLPFIGSTYTEFREKHQKAPVPDLPPCSIPQTAPLADIVQKCLAKNPDERYADFSHLQNQLMHLYKIIYSEEAPLPNKGENLNVIDLNNKGNSLSHLGRYEEAITCFDQALEIDSKDANTWSNKSATLGKLALYEEAITCCNRALEFNPKDAGAWFNKGTALTSLRRYEEGINCYDQALDIDPKLAVAFYNKGNVLRGLGKYEDAIVCYDYALKINPHNVNIWSNKGVALQNLGLNEEAISCHDHALEIDPRFADAWYNKGTVLLNLGRYEKAILCFDQALEFNSKTADAWFNKGVSHGELGQYEKAIHCYDNALAIDSQFTSAWLNKGSVLVKIGRHEEAIACFDHILEVDPQLVRVWYDKGNALAMLKRYEEAIFNYDNALVIDPKNADAWLAKGLALVIRGRLQEALPCFQNGQKLGHPKATQCIDLCKQGQR